MDVESALKYIDKQIIKDGEKYLRESVRFNIVQLQSCNGLTSCPFSKADCEFEFFKDEKGKRFISFAQLFKRGMTFLDEIVNVGKGKLEGPAKNAILCLGEFFKTKKNDEKSLNFVFKKRKSGTFKASETGITVALAEHLLKKLAPGGSYKVDANSHDQNPCLCGCNVKPNFSSTGMGANSVWHGFIDIVFTSPYQSTPESASDDVPAIAKALEGEEELFESLDESKDFEESPKMITEVKKNVSDVVLKQALAQTIVFSLIQRKRHPDRSNHMTPNIVISPKKFKIMLYDAENDIFLVSDYINLFNGDSLSNNAVIVLWMVLHNRMFCTGFNNVNTDIVSSLVSNFKNLVACKLETYSNLSECFVPKFHPKKNPSLNDSARGCEIDLHNSVAMIDRIKLDDEKPDA